MLRRDALRGAAAASLAVLAAAPARAGFVDAPDVVVFCDPPLREPVRRLGGLFQARTGVPVRMLCAPARIMAAQLVRNERADIIISLTDIVGSLAALGLAKPQVEVGTWRNRLVFARNGASLAPVSANNLVAVLGDGKLGAPDPSINAVIDTDRVLGALGLRDALAGRVVGEVDTGGVCWLLAHGKVAVGLVLQTDATEAGFGTLATIPEAAAPPLRYVAASSRHVLSRNAAPFMQFMADGEARGSLAESGLQIET